MVKVDEGQRVRGAAGRPSIRRGTAVGVASAVVGGAAGTLLTLAALPASASATITVDAAGDRDPLLVDALNCAPAHAVGACTLRDAAAAAVAGDTITFDPSLTTITLEASYDPVEFLPVTLSGPGASSLTITSTGTGTQRTLLNFVDAPGSVHDASISGVTLTRYQIRSEVSGTTTLDHVVVTNSTGTFGGGFYAAVGTTDIVITNSTFSSNSAYGNGNSSYGGAVSLSNTGTVTISDSTFTDNTADVMDPTSIYFGYSGAGGAIATNYGAGQEPTKITITRSTFSRNEATGTSGEFSSTGGAVTVLGSTTEIEITASTFDANVAEGNGGAVASDTRAAVLIANCTITGNSGYNGGGLSLYSPQLLQDTIVGNTSTSYDYDGTHGGGGLSVYGTGVLTGTVISGNLSTGGFADDIIYSDGYGGPGVGTLDSTSSMIGEVTQLNVNDLGGTIRGDVPALDPLAANGGPTRTMMPTVGSPLRDSGPMTFPPFPGSTYDQRGVGFLRTNGLTADIGAVFTGPPPPPTTTSTSTTVPVDPTTTEGGSEVVPEFTG